MGSANVTYSPISGKQKGLQKKPLGVSFWLRDQDSNLGPRGYEPRELPLLHPAIT